MSKKSNFSVMPSVSITRSKFIRKSKHKTSINLGDLVPIYLDEVLPGDTRKIDVGSLIRMSNPIAPFYDNVYADIYAFFVPNRIVWDHWKEFMGENSSGAGIYSGTEYKMPSMSVANIGIGTLGDYYGLPVGISGISTTCTTLPIRGYRRIYNRFFRDQNVIAPLTVNTGDTASAIYYDHFNQAPQKVAKVSDYFTRSLPYAQKGAPVSIPLGTTCPVITGDVNRSLVQNATGDISNNWYLKDSVKTLKYGAKADDEFGQGEFNILGMYSTDPASPARGNIRANSGTSTEGDSFDVAPINLYADLSTATAATINQLRFAFQYQKLLEKDALYGTRYWEIIKAHFNVVAPDASLQDPELLGHRKIYINVDQVVQTTGINQASPSSNELGQVAGISVTGDMGNLFTKSFTEHGYIHILVCFRHDQTYGQGIDRMWSRKVRTDFYFPVFANLGAQIVKRKEIYATGISGVSTDDDAVFGYQEAWAEYRYKPSKVTGLLNPHVTGSLGYWSLANNFASAPTLGQTFIEQGRANLERVLSTGNTGPDFICDFGFIDTAVRPMPLYSIPGLIDHH